jgi:hypothetical protein
MTNFCKQGVCRCNKRTLRAMGYVNPKGAHLEHMCTPLKHIISTFSTVTRSCSWKSMV